MKSILFIAIQVFAILLLSARTDTVNPDKPVKGGWDLNPQKVWEVTAYGKEPMVMPGVTTAWDDGTVCLLDWRSRMHYLFDGKGAFIASFAPRGEGPGEVKWSRGYFAVKDVLIIYDRPKLHYFSKTGAYIKSVPIGGRFDSPAAFIAPMEYISMPGAKGGRVAVVNLDTGTQKNLGDAESFSEGINLSKTRHRVSIVVPWSHPKFYLEYDRANKRMYYGNSGKYRIHFAGLDGKGIGKFSLKRKKRKISKQMKKEYAERNPGEARMASPEMRRRLPTRLNHFSKIQVENGLVYIFVTNHAEHWPDQGIDIFSPEGTYLYRSVFKPEGGRIIFSSSMFHGVILKNASIYAILETGEDEWALVKYNVSLPTP